MYAHRVQGEVISSQHGNPHLQLHPGGPHLKQAFGIMNELQLSQQLCDVTLQVKYSGRLLPSSWPTRWCWPHPAPSSRPCSPTAAEQGMEVVSIEGIHPKVMDAH